MAGRRDHHEQIFVAELEGLLLGAAGVEHDLAVLLGDHRRRRGEARRIGAEQELRFVLVDEPRVELLHAAAHRLVVIGDEFDHVALAAGLDAARGIDLVAPEFVAALLAQ